MEAMSNSKMDSYQIKCNEAELVMAHGLVLPEGVHRKQVIDSMFYSRERNPIFTRYPLVKENYERIAAELLAFRRRIAVYVQKAAEDPQSFGIDVAWRTTQREALEALALRLNQGFQHLALEIPTGVGKSMLIGAYLRAYFEVCRELNMLDDVEVILLTSRTNLVTQLMGPSARRRREWRPGGFVADGYELRDFYDREERAAAYPSSPWNDLRMDDEDAFEREEFDMGYLLEDDDMDFVTDDEEETSEPILAEEEIDAEMGNETDSDEGDDNALKLGDVKKWIMEILPKGQMRLITGETVLSERRKSAALTVMTYQGLSVIQESAIHRDRNVGLIFFDEAHRISPALRAQLKEKFPGALRVGGSATMKGPPGSRPFEVFESVGNEDFATGQSLPSQLAYYASIEQVIDRKELKPVRCLQKGVDIDLSDVSQTTAGNLNQEELTRKMMYSIPVLVQFIREAFQETFPVLELSGAKPIPDRTFIVSVKRIELAQKLAEICRKELGIEAEWTCGRDSKNAFEDKIRALSRRKFQMLFSAGKLGEGLDVTEVDGVMSLWPYNRGSSWVLKQLIGRGTRLHEGDRDCLVIEPLFEAGKHKLATTPDIFNVDETYPGALLAPASQRTVERKIIERLNKGIHTEYVWRKCLSDEEKKIAAEIGWEPGLASEKRTVDRIPVVHSQQYLERRRRKRFVRRPSVVATHDQKASEEQIVLEGLEREELVRVARKYLYQQGYTRKTFLQMTPQSFRLRFFGPFGNGRDLYRWVIGEGADILRDEHISALAHVLYAHEYARDEFMEAMRGDGAKSVRDAIRSILDPQTVERARKFLGIRLQRKEGGGIDTDEDLASAAFTITRMHDTLTSRLLEATDATMFQALARLVKVSKLARAQCAQFGDRK